MIALEKGLSRGCDIFLSKRCWFTISDKYVYYSLYTDTIEFMIKVDIPGLDAVEFEHFVTDFSGTLSEDGKIISGVRERLNELASQMQIHVLTSDTFGRAEKELKGINCSLHVLQGKGHTIQKEAYVKKLGVDRVVALGNGNNDVLMIKAARLGIAVVLKEGCSVETLKAASVLVMSPVDAIDLLLHPKRLIATLSV